MKNNWLITFSILLNSLMLSAQWSTDLTQNLPIANDSRISNVHYANNGYYFTWEDGSNGMYTHKVIRLNADGTNNWTQSMDAHNHPLGSSTLSLQHSFVDPSGNFIRVSSYNTDIGQSSCANKISENGSQLWNGAAGIVFNDIAMGAYLSPNNNLYVVSGDSLFKLNASGQIQWKSIIDPAHTNNQKCSILENTDGSVTVAYFVPGQFNPTYGSYYVSKFDNAGTRTTSGSHQIAASSSIFYTPTFFKSNSAGVHFFIYHDTNTGKSYLQKIVGDQPQISGLGSPLDGSVNSKYVAAYFHSDSLEVLYKYNWNSFDEAGLKHQTIDLNTMSFAYPSGNILYDDLTTNVQPLQNCMVNFNDDVAFLLLDNVSKKISLKVMHQGSISETYDICATSSDKGLAAMTAFDIMNNGSQQLVAFFEDYRQGATVAPINVAQNYTVTSTGLEQANFQSEIHSFPNPSNAFVTIEIPSNYANAVLTVLSIDGKVVLKTNLNKGSSNIDIQSLASGIYLMKINSNNQKLYQEKFIKE
jgi:hypothetical protein